MKFIILADKYQKGMKSRGCSGLIKINKKKFLFDDQYQIIKTRFPNAQIIYVGGFESKKIQTFIDKNYNDVIYVENKRYDTLSDGYTISLIQQLLIEEIFIVCGYTVLDKKMFQSFSSSKGSQLFISNKETHIGCTITDNQITHISLDLPNYLSNIYYISSEDCKRLQKIVSNVKYKNYFLFELINQLIDMSVTFRPFYYTITNKKKYEYTK
jgi:choline kinase